MMRHVTMVFGDDAEQVVALQDVNLTIHAGEFVSLVGPSGCGKTTCLRLVADLDSATAGEILVNGMTPREARLARQYGIVFQSPVLYDWRNVIENVMLPLRIMGCPQDEARASASELLDLVGLHEFKHRNPWELSGGMQQRVSIARALSFKPPILLMDEPFGALDMMTRERMNLELLRIWKSTNTTIVFVTHSVTEAVFLSDRVVVMTPRPGKAECIVDIDLPRPRATETTLTPEYVEQVAFLRECLKGVE